ncbi:Golgin subfamily A member 2 [Gryllus bimaculatus]|nr:Golgin subfamily A member 2 [Gryllus bimaculatus]
MPMSHLVGVDVESNGVKVLQISACNMADMSQDEKRAAGWRKIEHPKVPSPVAELEKQPVSPIYSKVSEKLHNENSETQTQIISTDHSVGSFVTNDVPPLMSAQSLATQGTVPVSANIFSSNFSSGANSYSEFFDNIQSGSDRENVFLPMNRTNVSADLSVDTQTIVKSPPFDEVQAATDHMSDELAIPESAEQKNVSDITDNSEKKSFHSVSQTDTKENNVKPEVTEEISNLSSAPSVLPSNFASSAESLRQLSLELSGLIDESVVTSAPTSVPPTREMERRNQELAALLASEQQKCERLQLQMKEYESRVSQLQIEASQHQTEQLARLQRELSTAQEQLQLHVQTVGILVGEKAELEAALSKSQQTAKQKAADVEELQGRLKASRHKVSDLERELGSATTASKQLESSVQQQNKELTRLKLEKEMASKQLEEIEEEAAELRQNLDVRTNEAQTLQHELREKQSQLDLAQLKIQQLSLSDMTEMEKQLESLHQQKVGLERQLAELQQTVQALGSERDQANSQYQEYLHHVNGQMKSMADKLASATAENEQLSNREQSLVKHLSELEKQLQLLQQQNQRNRGKDSPSHVASTELIQRLEQNIHTLEEEKEKLTLSMDSQIQENKVVQDQLDMYMSRVEELESMVESLKADQPDTRKLLAAMESDKVAASRAVGQNQKLKEQLLELEEGFIQVSNQKVDLTQELQKEQHLSKELGERLAQQELEISELRTQLAENEKMLQSLQKSTSEQLSRQMLKEDQIADQMRHYEAQGHMTETLQRELHQSKEVCRTLRAENDELRMKLARATVPDVSEATEDQRDDLVESLKASVRQLTMERDQLLSQLQEKPPRESVGTDAPDDSFSNSDIDVKEYCNLKESMEKLQTRFSKTMEEVAELSDEKQRLEHLVLQLQGETETIGEYIALYQMQRSILRQRAQEKDEQLARLARDREEVKIKLNELNRLIGQLVAENGKGPTSVSVSTSTPELNSVSGEPASEDWMKNNVLSR